MRGHPRFILESAAWLGSIRQLRCGRVGRHPRCKAALGAGTPLPIVERHARVLPTHSSFGAPGRLAEQSRGWRGADCGAAKDECVVTRAWFLEGERRDWARSDSCGVGGSEDILAV